MSALESFLKASAHGVQLQLSAGGISYDAPRGLPPELKTELTNHRLEIIEFLGQPGQTSRELWTTALEEIAKAWTAHATGRRAQGLEPLWLEESFDLGLQDEIAQGIRAGDLERTLVAITHWRQSWLELLAGAVPAPGTEESRGWVELDSAVLGEHVIVALTQEAVPDAKAARPDLVVYGPDEIDHLYGIKDSNLLRAVHVAKRELNARVGDPRKADVILAEYEGRIRHPNPGVHAIFDEAKRRFGEWVEPEKSITCWLKQHAPSVAAIWPDAPPTASWFDWRVHVDPEHIAVLDEAWRAALVEKKRIQP